LARGEISSDGLDIKSEAPKNSAQIPAIIGRIKYHPTFANACAINLILLPGFCAGLRCFTRAGPHEHHSNRKPQSQTGPVVNPGPYLRPENQLFTA
jgi:hypothetical protein